LAILGRESRAGIGVQGGGWSGEEGAVEAFEVGLADAAGAGAEELVVVV
jgi:hypothetical protein